MPIPWFHQALLPPPSPPLAMTANDDDDDVDPDNKLPCLLGLREAPWPGFSFRSGASRRVTFCSSETLILTTDQPTHALSVEPPPTTNHQPALHCKKTLENAQKQRSAQPSPVSSVQSHVAPVWGPRGQRPSTVPLLLGPGRGSEPAAQSLHSWAWS